MEENNKLCSSTEHEEETVALSFCPKCDIYMCKKCEISHSKLLKKHEIFQLGKDNKDNFTGFCKENNHQKELDFFCKTHNQLCCAVCISKIKKNEIGKHGDCEIIFNEEIKEEKIKQYKENIQILKELSENINKSIEEIKLILENIDKNKEELKLKIQKIFTKLRNDLNNREDQLLLEVDKIYADIKINNEILKKYEKLPNKIKSLLEKNNINIENKENKLNYIINHCINIEKYIQELNMITESIKKYKTMPNIKYNFYPIKEEDIKFLEDIKTFGKICLPKKIINYNLIMSRQLDSGICSVIILSNKDIAVGKRNGELIIFNQRDLQEITKIQAHSDGNTSIYSLLELRDKSIITCGGNKTMKNYIYNINDKKLIEKQELFCKNNSGYICRAIELPDNNLVSSDNSNILIWKRDENDKYKIIKEITDFGGVMQHLALINDKYIVCHNNSGVLRIYDSEKHFKLEKEIKSLISYEYMHRFCTINSDLFCLSGDQFIYFISISKMEVIKSLKVDNINFHSIMLLSNSTLLCGAYEQNNSYHLFQFQINENAEIKLISRSDNIHSSIIWQLSYMESTDKSEKIISVSDDKYLKIFELNYEI